MSGFEALAVRQVPHLDVTTSAFSVTGTGQINQLAFYDEYARRLNPKLNDFADNSKPLTTGLMTTTGAL